MGGFKERGVRPIINAAGPVTRLGGALMRPEVVAAMAGAASECVAMVELQAAASRAIAEATGAEAGYVTSGAAAGLTLATAACIAGLDIRRMDRLPDTDGMPNEVIIAREHRSGYDHAIRAAGARLVDVGMNEVWAGAGVRASEAWEYEAAIGDKTAAIAYFFRPDSSPPLDEVIHVGKAHRVPVLVDAAAQLPPAENLRHFVDMGADLVSFSGGKGLRGPQNTGILAGSRDLIASVALQNLDLDEHFRIWEPPATLIPKDELRGLPRHGIGRGFKVSKEAIVGLLTALDLFTREGCLRDSAAWLRMLESVAHGLDGLEGVRAERQQLHDAEAVPLLNISIDSVRLGQDAFQVARRLKNGAPPVYVGEKGLPQGILVINPLNLTEEQAAILVRRLREVLAGMG